MLLPNILFIEIDSFRADKCYSYKKTSKTPNIDALIKQGVYFEQTISSAYGTAISWASIFTGLHPTKTGVNSIVYNKLHSSAHSYYNILKEAGYHAYAKVPKVADALGLTPDFENKDKTYEFYFHLSDGLGQEIINLLRSKTMKEPWIFFIHFLDLHNPIIVSNEFDYDKYGSSKYERMVSTIDSWLGKILANIDMEKTLVILTADHGEYVQSVSCDGQTINLESNGRIDKTATKIGSLFPEFLFPLKNKLFLLRENLKKRSKLLKIKNLNLTAAEKRALLTQRSDIMRYLFDDLIHVPLIFAGCGVSSRPIVKQQVRSIDIFPTIADIIGLKKRDVDGVSLLPLIKGETLEEKPAYFVSAPVMFKESEQIVGVRTSEYKYFRGVNKTKNTIHLFDLRNDPYEENNIIDKKPEIAQRMESILTEIRNDAISLEELEMNEDDTRKIERELKKLGYV